MKHSNEPREEAPVVGFTDENGVENVFHILALIPYSGSEYAVMLPEEDCPAYNGKYYIFEVIEELDSDADTYRGVEDEAVIEAVYALFCGEGE